MRILILLYFLFGIESYAVDDFRIYSKYDEGSGLVCFHKPNTNIVNCFISTYDEYSLSQQFFLENPEPFRWNSIYFPESLTNVWPQMANYFTICGYARTSKKIYCYAPYYHSALKEIQKNPSYVERLKNGGYVPIQGDTLNGVGKRILEDYDAAQEPFIEKTIDTNLDFEFIHGFDSRFFMFGYTKENKSYRQHIYSFNGKKPADYDIKGALFDLEISPFYSHRYGSLCFKKERTINCPTNLHHTNGFVVKVRKKYDYCLYPNSENWCVKDGELYDNKDKKSPLFKNVTDAVYFSWHNTLCVIENAQIKCQAKMKSNEIGFISPKNIKFKEFKVYSGQTDFACAYEVLTNNLYCVKHTKEKGYELKLVQ